MSGRDLAGRVALVTGGGQGIGAACARLLAARGARVVVAARGAERLAQVVGEIESAGGEALAVPCDVSSPEQVRNLFAVTLEQLGPVELLVNNAGVALAAPLQGVSLADWERLWQINVTGTLLCAQEALGHMLPRKRGVVVNVASVAGVSGIDKFPGFSAYAATKGAVIAFSEALGAEVSGQGVRVVAVSPGGVRTPMLEAAAPDYMDHAMLPEQVAEVICFLGSDAGAAVQKTNVVVWGPARAAP